MLYPDFSNEFVFVRCLDTTQTKWIKLSDIEKGKYKCVQS